MRHGISFAGTALSVVLVVLGLSIFTVDQRQHAIIFQLGEVKEVITEPGLYFNDMLLDELKDRGLGPSVDWDRVAHFKPYGGIRIEDDVVCTEGEPENLTREAFAAA